MVLAQHEVHPRHGPSTGGIHRGTPGRQPAGLHQPGHAAGIALFPHRRGIHVGNGPATGNRAARDEIAAARQRLHRRQQTGQVPRVSAGRAPVRRGQRTVHQLREDGRLRKAQQECARLLDQDRGGGDGRGEQGRRARHRAEAGGASKARYETNPWASTEYRGNKTRPGVLLEKMKNASPNSQPSHCIRSATGARTAKRINCRVTLAVTPQSFDRRAIRRVRLACGSPDNVAS